MPGGTVTFLFTDLVGSTERLDRLGDDAAETLRRTHFRLLRDAVTGLGGEEVKNLGDGLMTVFASAVDAVSCAVAMQHAVYRHNQRADDDLQVRIGLNVGEPVVDEGDYFGTPVVVAKRLCDQAVGGQIIASDLVRGLVGSRGAHSFGDLGDLELKGLSAPIASCEVVWERPGVFALPLPAAVAGTDRAGFIGRADERAQLRRSWARARSGERQLVLLAGEPGIGKTRLASELALEVHGEGATVLFGRCDEEVLVPYQPFVEALRHYVTNAPTDELRAALAGSGGDLARMVPEVGQQLPSLPPPVGSDPETERYRLFQAVAALLGDLSRRAPLLLVLDDLHWADKPTLMLLRHLQRASDDAAMLIVGTYRDVELDRRHPLSEALAAMRRERPAERILLRGLTVAEVRALLESRAGHEMDPAGVALAEALHRETEGNAFFIGEILRHLVESGRLFRREGRWTSDAIVVDQLDIPEGVREVIGRRLSRLSETANRTLATASVIGRDFGIDVLEPLTEVSGDELVDVLEEAVQARVIGEVPGTVDRYTFAHALVREALYEELSTSRRVRLHRRIGHVLEDLHTPHLESHLAEMAHHFFEAAEGGDADKAIDYSRRAGDQDMSQLAFERAASHYEQALQALELTDAPDRSRRCELLIALAPAKRHAGESHDAEEIALEAADLARALRSPELLARTALVLDDASWIARGFAVDPMSLPAAKLLREALGELGEGQTPLHGLVLARLPRSQYQVTTPEDRLPWAEQAEAIAVATGDLELKFEALEARLWALWAPDGIDDLLETSLELARLGDGNPQLEWPRFAGQVWRLAAALTLCDMPTVDEAIVRLEVLADEARDPVFRWYPATYGAMRSLFDGRFEEAEQRAAEALAVSERMQSDWGMVNFGAQLFILRREQGRLAELEPVLLGLVAENPHLPAWRAALGDLYVELGRRDEARGPLEHFAAMGFGAIPKDFLWMVLMHELSEVAHFLDDAERAAELYELMAPYGHHNVVVGPGITASGCGSRNLGLLATTLERWDAAERHFEVALATNARMGGRPWVTRTQYNYASMLSRRRRPGDLERATEMLRSAQAEAEAMGQASIAGRAEELLATCSG